MRTFDYRHLSRTLFEGGIGDALARVHEDRGKLEVIKRTDQEVLAALQDQARFDSVDASLRIEGFYLDAARVRDLIAGAAPLNDTEAQVVGYANALRLVEAAGESAGGAQGSRSTAECGGDEGSEGADHFSQDLDISTATVLTLYETLYAHRALGRKSRYRKKDYVYAQVDGKPRAVPVSPIAAFETPLVLGGACDGLAEALAAGAANPVVLAAVFTVDFLAIRPFDEGNGRISRLFAEFLIARAGVDVFRYASIDREIERSGMAYYDALNACVEGWDRSANDYAPFVRFWLDTLHAAYERLFGEVERARTRRGTKADRVREHLRHAHAAVTKRQIIEAFPDISEATVEATLGALVKEGAIEKQGAGRSTAYRWR